MPAKAAAVAEPEIPSPPDPNEEAWNLQRAIMIFEGDEWKTLNLVQQLARISGFLGAVPKKGYNSFHKYHYVTEGDLVGAVRRYLAAAGILMIPNVTSTEQIGEMTNVMVEYTVTNGSESFTFSVPGAGSDRGDKGVYKALTGSMKYAIMKLFKIETGDDPEADTRVDERAAQTDAPRARPSVTSGQRGDIGRGAHTAKASPVQLRRISSLVQELDLPRAEFVTEITKISGEALILPEEEEGQSKVILDALKALSTGQAGQLIEVLYDRTQIAEHVAADLSGY